MASDLGQILGGLFGQARGGGQSPMGGSSGGLGDLLGGMLGRGQGGSGGGGFGGLSGGPGGLGGLGGLSGRGSAMGGKGGLMAAMLLPLAMQWVQRNGGVSGVLDRFRQKGYSQQAASWVSTGPNESLPPEAVGDIVGNEELSRLSQQLGVDNQQVSAEMAHILPEVVNQLTPDGNVPADSDNVLGQGLRSLEQFLNSPEQR